MYKKILLAYDGSIEGRRALREGAKLAQSCGAEVFLLAVVETASSVASLEGGVMISMDEQFANYQAILAEGVERLKTMGFSPTARLGMGDAGQVITEVLSKSEVKNYSKGAVLIKKGSVPESLYIIRKGKVGIYNEDILLAELEELAIMGESFLAEATATATTIALTDVTTIEIQKDDFYWLAIKHPRLVFNIFSINNKRLRSSNDAALLEARTREERLQRLVEERTAELNLTLAELRETQKFRDQFLRNAVHEEFLPSWKGSASDSNRCILAAMRRGMPALREVDS